MKRHLQEYYDRRKSIIQEHDIRIDQRSHSRKRRQDFLSNDTFSLKIVFHLYIRSRLGIRQSFLKSTLSKTQY